MITHATLMQLAAYDGIIACLCLLVAMAAARVRWW